MGLVLFGDVGVFGVLLNCVEQVLVGGRWLEAPSITWLDIARVSLLVRKFEEVTLSAFDHLLLHDGSRVRCHHYVLQRFRLLQNTVVNRLDVAVILYDLVVGAATVGGRAAVVASFAERIILGNAVQALSVKVLLS